MNVFSCYRFGKFFIRVHALSEEECLFPLNIGNYSIDVGSNQAMALNLHMDRQLCPVVPLLGWSENNTADSTVVSYCDEHNVLFQLQYSDHDYAHTKLHYNPLYRSSASLGLQHAVMLALSTTTVGLHGVTVLCRDQAIILSAPSGTGKTTLAKLLQKHCDAAIVNGDFALLTPCIEHGIVFEPTPFCGTSKVCHNVRLPISAVVFLEQSSEMQLQALSARESLTHFLSNAFVPQWNEKLRDDIEAVAAQIVNQVSMYRFAFPPTADAARRLCQDVIK